MSPIELCTSRQAPSDHHSRQPLLRARSSPSSGHPWLRLALKAESNLQTILSAHNKPCHHLLGSRRLKWAHFQSNYKPPSGGMVPVFTDGFPLRILDNPLCLSPNTISIGAGKQGTGDRVHWSGCEQTKANHLSQGLCSLHRGYLVR